MTGSIAVEAGKDGGIRSLLANRQFALHLAARISIVLAAQMIFVAVGWQVYEISHTARALGYTGLAGFLPLFLLSLPAGDVADRYDRRRIMATCLFGFAAGAGILGVVALRGGSRTWPIYAVIVALGAIRAFMGPSTHALVPMLVPRRDVERAIALGSSCWQLAMIVGPSAGGLLYAAIGRAAPVYFVATALALAAFVCVMAMGDVAGQVREAPAASRAQSLIAGLRFVWNDKVLLGALSLDLFAVLLGGTVALLPIFAHDILHIGPRGLGVLRSAPAVAAATVAFLLASFPLKERAGAAIFASIFIYGLATIVFGISQISALSFGALLVIGAADMISVVIRQTLIQTQTPDAMRGRVGAVSLVFIGTANELGEFESGLVADWLGPKLAVVVGGVGTCLVVIAWSVLFPQLRRVGFPGRKESP